MRAVATANWSEGRPVDPEAILQSLRNRVAVPHGSHENDTHHHCNRLVIVPSSRFVYCDTIWTKRWAFTNNAADYWSTYQTFQREGRDIWFYMCEGPVRQFDPAYYRFQPWQCLRAGATGSAFWAYCDGGGERSWCPYAAWRKKNNFTPVYIGLNSVTTSKHWEAAREGVEDHQYLVMLRGRVRDLDQRGVNSALVREAAQLASSLPDNVVRRLDAREVLTGHKEWSSKLPSLVAEDARLRVLDMLVKLNGLMR